MTMLSRSPSLLASLMIVPLLMAPLPIATAATPKAKAAKSVPSPVVATKDIIPLPLNPTLPSGQRLCAEKAASGLGYTMLRPAPGAGPAEADYVLVNYIGYLAATGAVFDQRMQAVFPVNGVIPGFSKGLQMLTKGSVARFCIPAAMGYGAQDSGTIPANSDLVFQVELVDYKTAAEMEEMRKASGSAPEHQTDTASPPQ
jgi:FKBP-type peptidyl-prolyl cis-trans isomerase FkpA